jgi:cardiolipin synthase C
LLAELARRGVKVRVLTNSLAASDESIVHAGYMKRRRDLLLAGVALYELKPTAMHEKDPKVKGHFGSGKAAGLHAKTYAVDRARIFVGSFNFDLRSARLNTEMGVVIDSAVFAGDLATFFDTSVPRLAYEVRLAPTGDGLIWIERTASGEEKRYDADPETDGFKRWKVEVLSTLPIDWLL